MRSQDRYILEYRPNIEYRPPKSYYPIILKQHTEYTPSNNIFRAISLIPSGLLGEIEDNIQDAKMLANRIASCFDSKEYLKAREEDKLKARDLLQQNSKIEGNIQLETLPHVLNTIDNYEILEKILSTIIYKDNKNKDIKELEEIDKKYLDDLIDKQINNKMTDRDINILQTRVIEIEGINRLNNNNKTFIKNLHYMLCSTLNQGYNGNIKGIIKEYSEAENSVLKVLKQTKTVDFNKKSMILSQDEIRAERLNQSEMTVGLVKTFSAISELRDNNLINEWLSKKDTNSDQDYIITKIMEESLSDVEFLKEEYNKAKVEFYKQIKLDELVKKDIVSSLEVKNEARKKYNLIKEILEEKESNSFTLESFISKRGLELEGTICSRW